MQIVFCGLVFVLLTVVVVEGARILAVVPGFHRSHHVIIQSVLKTLAQAGHELVVYSPFLPENIPQNYTHFTLHDLQLSSQELDGVTQSLQETPTWKCYDNVLRFHEIIFHRVFGNELIKRLIRSKEMFDLVITEPLISQEYMLIFGHIFKAPTIGIASSMTSYLINNHMGNSLSLAYIPDKCVPYTTNMSFRERFFNVFCILRGIYVYYNRHIPAIEGKMKELFPKAPPVLELTNQLSLMFVNDHSTADYAQPRSHTMVPIGGIHIQPAQQLPKDMKEFMDGATEGAILFSLGTYVSDEEKFNVFLSVFGRLRQRVLWKSTVDRVDGIPENVMLVKWLPQRDVLAHCNCVLFITHGGMASLHETIYTGVPVVGIPYFIDQHRNVAYLVEKGVGVRVGPEELSHSTLAAAIRTVLTEHKYKENMKRMSGIFRDRPMCPSQTVVYWTEYVLRHGGAPHLKPSSTLLSWYQLALLDVFAITVALSIITFYSLYSILNNVIVKRKNSILLMLNQKNK